ncbi:hypothetical protein BKA82DRAFT_495428 [Pisolithus tinctorius]|uniref:Uncharacterized protein n=1 Tax=Pisolithus tinctorius Marx 270 TaxID=870435 RepID=A0A0C3NZ64_PISTI|nr:hypothetical protein BKA82DRAFT_495428 [Pisolithus tinctorius]KIO06135.1 hypothetical protein M404DRAFT_495428 [Pisolithus tinctorius Marx 270]
MWLCPRLLSPWPPYSTAFYGNHAPSFLHLHCPSSSAPYAVLLLSLYSLSVPSEIITALRIKLGCHASAFEFDTKRSRGLEDHYVIHAAG